MSDESQKVYLLKIKQGEKKGKFVFDDVHDAVVFVANAFKQTVLKEIATAQYSYVRINPKFVSYELRAKAEVVQPYCHLDFPVSVVTTLLLGINDEYNVLVLNSNKTVQRMMPVIQAISRCRILEESQNIDFVVSDADVIAWMGPNSSEYDLQICPKNPVL